MSRRKAISPSRSSGTPPLSPITPGRARRWWMATVSRSGGGGPRPRRAPGAGGGGAGRTGGGRGAAAPRLGGLIEFYRSSTAQRWTPTGANVPDYSGMANQWWRQLHPAVAGQLSAAQALQNLAAAFDRHLQQIGQRQQHICAPRLNPPRAPIEWLQQAGAPWPALTDGRPAGRTLPYEEALRAWD